MMATYFNGGSEIQADNLQTLYLMNPSYAPYADNQPPPGMLLNHAPPHFSSQQQLVGIPLAQPGTDNLWGAVAAEPPSSGGHHIPTAIAVSGSGDFGSAVNFRRPPSLDHHQHQQQGLSLSLNNSSPASASGVTTYGGDGGRSTIMGSKYLKAAQQLLDEVVNVGKALEMADSDGSKHKAKAKSAVIAGEGSSSCGKQAASTTDLTTAQRQELQMKKAKLLNMLDEVEQRYRQYHSHMQMVASSFEQAAGGGSARSYTALALQTISKQFRCLKDAITSQIRTTGRSLGEEEDVGGTSSGSRGGSRLRMVDYQLRQQRALQQLGMMHQNAWRPQRGLPERAVSVLRAWLFEHFLHPYPKDSDKHMLAKQTGLTRSQVSNWFINARVRLWKPMVEEMYLEELKSQDKNASDDQTNNSNNSTKLPPTDQAPLNNQTPLAPPPPSTNSSAPMNLHEVGAALQGFSFKRQRSSPDMQNSPSSILSMDMEMKPAEDPSRDLFNPPGYGPYPIGDIGSRFNPNHHHLGQCYQQGNAVSLTLGLPHGDHNQVHHHNFIPGQPRRLDIGIGDAELCGITTSQPPHSGGARGYDGMDMENRKRYAAQLLPDFVT